MITLGGFLDSFLIPGSGINRFRRVTIILTNYIAYDKVTPEEAELHKMLEKTVSPALFFADFIFTSALSALGGTAYEKI